MAQQFPKDRFDVIPPDLERVGAHRAPFTRAHGLLWLAWCLVAILVIVGAGWIYLRGLDKGASDSSAESESTAAATATPTSSATASATPTATSNPTPTATLVPSATVRVLNGAGTAGLAAQGAAKLQAVGWTSVSTGNATQSGLSTSAVYYSDATLRGVALGVAQSLGIATVAQSADYSAQGVQVVAVLGTDFTG